LFIVIIKISVAVKIVIIAKSCLVKTLVTTITVEFFKEWAAKKNRGNSLQPVVITLGRIIHNSWMS